jgi:hypothetical protein
VNATRGLLAAVVFALAAGCGSGSVNTRVERCVDRLLTGAASDPRSDEGVRDYARRTYCDRFERNGWIYDDGALTIEAQEWLDEGGTCEAGGEGEPMRAGSCEELRRTDPIIDCALLHHIRKSEVRTYLEELDRTVPVRCDDGTPLDELGVP